MNFKHACFISYRHGQGELIRGFLDQFSSALKSELELRLAVSVYFDTDRLHAGAVLNSNLALALCESVCMIMIYTPRYFAEDSTYCSREFLAMQAIAEKRQALLQSSQLNSFIVPVVLRGTDSFPNKIFGSSPVIYSDFSRFSLSDRKILKNSSYFSEVQKIADHIVNIHSKLVAKQPCKDCAQSTFPDEPTALQWLRTTFNSSSESFPFRS